MGRHGTDRVGAFPPLHGPSPVPASQKAFVVKAADAGLDHVCTSDHVNYFVGAGFDGLVNAAALALAHSAIPVHVGVYLLPLRHPTLVACRVADLEVLAPGRLVRGVGIGGEDRRE